MILWTRFSGKATETLFSEPACLASSMARSYPRQYVEHFSQRSRWSCARMRSGGASSSSLNACKESTNSSHVIAFFFITATVGWSLLLAREIAYESFPSESVRRSPNYRFNAASVLGRKSLFENSPMRIGLRGVV